MMEVSVDTKPIPIPQGIQEKTMAAWDRGYDQSPEIVKVAVTIAAACLTFYQGHTRISKLAASYHYTHPCDPHIDLNGEIVQNCSYGERFLRGCQAGAVGAGGLMVTGLATIAIASVAGRIGHAVGHLTPVRYLSAAGSAGLTFTFETVRAIGRSLLGQDGVRLCRMASRPKKSASLTQAQEIAVDSGIISKLGVECGSEVASLLHQDRCSLIL